MTMSTPTDPTRLAVFVRGAGAVVMVGAVSALVNAITGDLWGTVGLSLGSALCGGLVVRVRRRGRIGHEAHALATVIWLVVVALTYRAGGAGAPGMHALAVLPAIVALLAGARAAVGWAVVCALPAVVFTAFDHLLPPSSLTGDTLVAMQMMGPIGAIILFTATALAYERVAQNREASLQDARVEAERSRQAAEAARIEAEQARVEAEQARQRAEEANQAKTAFLTTMSHELRTPVMAVTGLAELLEASEADQEQKRRLGLLRGAGRTVLGLVDDILDIARIEAGKLELQSAPLDLGAALDDVSGSLSLRAEARGVALFAHQAGPRWVAGDALRLRQILFNLVGNAVKFTRQGEIRVSVIGEAAESKQVAVTLTVSDTGVGIPAERHAHVLQPFNHGAGAPPRANGGSGLGLSIVVRLVEEMNGTLHLDSAPGRGTTFTVRLVLPAAASTAPTHTTTPEVAGTRVLVAEDNALNQHVLRMMFERMGCAVEVVSDGHEAIEALRTGTPPHLVFMDRLMPRLDGTEATRRLRAVGYAGTIIGLTAGASASDREACLEAGMDGFASKPITLPELRALVERHTGGRHGD